VGGRGGGGEEAKNEKGGSWEVKEVLAWHTPQPLAAMTYCTRMPLLVGATVLCS